MKVKLQLLYGEVKIEEAGPCMLLVAQGQHDEYVNYGVLLRPFEVRDVIAALTKAVETLEAKI